MEKQNPEGLTFEEWVCAAGVAVYNGTAVRPYSESETRHVCNAYARCAFPVRTAVSLDWASEEAIKRLDASSCRRYWLRGYRVYVKRYTRVFYPKKVREAWRAGEDPTDWRALNNVPF